MDLRLRDTLAAKTTKSSGCWEWRGNFNNKGYGTLHYGGVTRGAHRWAYILAKGPIPRTTCVLHRCDNRKCLRLSHLYAGTHKQNAADRERRGRGGHVLRRGSRNGSVKLTEAQVLAIFAAPGTYKSIGDRYGVSATTIGFIKNGTKWAWLTGVTHKKKGQ